MDRNKIEKNPEWKQREKKNKLNMQRERERGIVVAAFVEWFEIEIVRKMSDIKMQSNYT